MLANQMSLLPIPDWQEGQTGGRSPVPYLPAVKDLLSHRQVADIGAMLDQLPGCQHVAIGNGVVEGGPVRGV